MLRFLLLHLHCLTLTGSHSDSGAGAPMQVQEGQAPLLQLWTGSVDDDADFLVDELRVLLSLLTNLVFSDKGTRVACGKRAALETRVRAGAVKRVQRTIARLHDGGGEAEDDKGQGEGQGEGEPENDEEEEEEDVDDLVGRKLEAVSRASISRRSARLDIRSF
ncbi:hypothetical protein OC842_005670 [Tilletia horrida]|uniref:Uncharacterized protein n=1 Tax=Tilletia horrida TaxID=155126 RepID=A0AAN6G8R9_9BASI|nr:hypothetical protein OC842_005670 [Tilletia horrida]